MKKICILLIAAMALLTMSAFAETDLQQLEAANKITAVHEVYPSTAYTITYYDTESGEAVDSFTCYGISDPEKGTIYAYKSLTYGDIEVTGRGEGYGYSAAGEMNYIMMFVKDMYEESVLYYTDQNLGEFIGGEQIVDEQIGEDGQLSITTELAIDENDEYYGDEFGNCTLVARYTVNPENLIISTCEISVRGEDGAEKKYCDMQLKVDPEIKLPLEKPASDKGEREVHIIADPGTADEFEYVFTAPIDVTTRIMMPEDYALYSDAECTTIFEGTGKDENGNFPETQTIYCAPIAE